MPKGLLSFGVKPLRISIPPELSNVTTLLSYLGASAEEVQKIRWYRHRMYHHFELPKGDGKTRKISAPDRRLKFLQRKIAILLDQIYPVRNPVHGFVLGRSVKTNALAHMPRRFVVNIDLKDFFPAIKQSRIRGVLTALAVDANVASTIATICCNENHLPQGAPTSPVLSNMVCFRLDKQLLSVAKEGRCIYTRYADDITFSSYQPITSLFEGAQPTAGRFSPEMLATNVKTAIAGNGFAIHPDKAHYADRHSRRMVTGLKINEILNVDRRFVRNIRSALHSVEKDGVAEAQKRFEVKYGGKSSIAAHLAGKISWLGYIKGQTDPVFRGIAVRFNQVFPDRKLKVTPTATEIRDRSVWIIDLGEAHEEGSAQGTAFFLKGVGLITAAHCVDGELQLTVYHPTKTANRFKVAVSKIDKHRDLAILSHAIPPTEFYELEASSQEVKLESELTAVGYPGFGPGDGINVRSGRVSSLPVKSAVQLIEVTQKLVQGMSGGPLLDNDNKVVGVIHKGGPGEGRDFAIHVAELTNWLAAGE